MTRDSIDRSAKQGIHRRVSGTRRRPYPNGFSWPPFGVDVMKRPGSRFNGDESGGVCELELIDGCWILLGPFVLPFVCVFLCSVK
jgi:hypothetical protein